MIKCIGGAHLLEITIDQFTLLFRYGSTCRPRSTYVMALVKKPWDERFDWNWIQVETSCTCAITPTTPPG